MGGLCSPSTEVCLGPCPALLPGPVHCSSVIFLAVCLSVCFVFVVSKGSISVSAPTLSPSPPCACRSLFTLFISQRGHCQLPHLAGFRAQRFWQSQSIPCKTALERRGSCCGSVESRSPWQVPPGSSSLLSGQPAWLREQSTERGQAAVPSTNTDLLSWMLHGEECLAPRCVGGGEPHL